jgi:hypothetical protein
MLVLVGWLAVIAWNALFGKQKVVDACRVVGQSTGTVYSMTPEKLLNASIITDVAMRRDLPQRAVLVAPATALQESQLRNLDYGDADSLGLFQQRPSQGWGTPTQIMTPTYAAGKFYDELLKVPNWQSLSVTEAADAVQRSAFPTAYAGWEPRATALSAALTGDTLGQLSCRLADPGVPASSTPDAATGKVTAGLRADLAITSPAVAPLDSKTRTVTVSGLSGVSAGGAADAKHRTATVAAWAIAHARSDGITRVVVGDRQWRADKSGWHNAKDAAPTGSVILVVTQS